MNSNLHNKVYFIAFSETLLFFICDRNANSENRKWKVEFSMKTSFYQYETEKLVSLVMV